MKGCSHLSQFEDWAGTPGFGLESERGRWRLLVGLEVLGRLFRILKLTVRHREFLGLLVVFEVRFE